MIIFFKDAEEEDHDIENGEEVHELMDDNLISGLSATDLTISEDFQPQLIPGLSDMQTEPDYNTLDNMTLLASLNIQQNNDDKLDISNSLIPDLNWFVRNKYFILIKNVALLSKPGINEGVLCLA